MSAFVVLGPGKWILAFARRDQSQVHPDAPGWKRVVVRDFAKCFDLAQRVLENNLSHLQVGEQSNQSKG